ncbi:MAG: winged helix-turn-helix domain-containing protein [Candidatus Aminicenantes bacterium]|nr:winged helix-turn-helix domain-containing protein [Candidatus Aminicenantes bacterium]
MLEAILESSLKEKVLFFLLVNDDAYPREIAANFGFNLNAVQYQLKKMESAGVLYSQARGKILLYGLNPGYTFARELNALLKKAFSLLKASEKEKLYLRHRSGKIYDKIILDMKKSERMTEKEKPVEPIQKFPRKSEPLDFSTD